MSMELGDSKCSSTSPTSDAFSSMLDILNAQKVVTMTISSEGVASLFFRLHLLFGSFPSLAPVPGKPPVSLPETSHLQPHHQG